MLSSGMHGGERSGPLGLYLVLSEMLSGKHAQFGYLNSRVRLVVLPIVNPWGYSQVGGGSRQNSRGVDMARNFDYKWSSYTGDHLPGQSQYKGTAPFSEAETQIIRDCLLSIPDRVGYIDYHALWYPSEHYYLALPVYEAFDRRGMRNLIDRLRRSDAETEFWAYNPSPNQFNWAAAVAGVQAFSPEFPDSKYGLFLDAVEMREVVRWYGNILIWAGAWENARVYTRGEPKWWFVDHYNTTGNEITWTNTSYAELSKLRIPDINIPSSGVVEITGYAQVLGTVTGQNIYLLPRASQSQTEWADLTGTRSDLHESRVKCQDTAQAY